MPSRTPQEIVDELHNIDPAHEYYAITLLGSENDDVSWSVYSHCVGLIDNKPGREIREASLIRATRMAEIWDTLREPYIVVNDPPSLVMYLHLGGHALVERGVAISYLPDIIALVEQVFDGPIGFKNLHSLPDYAFKRAPRPKHRMRILQRDNRKCRICGRRPDEYTDLELHVHHIRPWENGGLTEDDNLITLCQACHKGLDPHEDLSLFSLINPDKWSLDSDTHRREYIQRVQEYRETIKK